MGLFVQPLRQVRIECEVVHTRTTVQLVEFTRYKMKISLSLVAVVVGSIGAVASPVSPSSPLARRGPPPPPGPPGPPPGPGGPGMGPGMVGKCPVSIRSSSWARLPKRHVTNASHRRTAGTKPQQIQVAIRMQTTNVYADLSSTTSPLAHRHSATSARTLVCFYLTDLTRPTY